MATLRNHRDGTLIKRIRYFDKKIYTSIEQKIYKDISPRQYPYFQPSGV